jgi:glyoxylase-like metal-dependent hydrolase (beta-lactamase superfamily II)
LQSAAGRRSEDAPIRRSTALHQPHPEPPAPGAAVEVAPGILWFRLPLPFRLDHVNVYAIDDGQGWAVIDAGIGDAATKAAWEALLAGPLAGRPITRLLVTHMHPDHIGAAGWLGERLGLPLDISESEYLLAHMILSDPEALATEPYRGHFAAHGLAPEVTEQVLTRGHDYLRMLTGLPKTYRRLIAGDQVILGERRFAVLTGGGHASEMLMLHCAAEGLFLPADQVLPKMTPNVSVHARDPDGDPLGIFLRSLRSVRAAVPDEVLVLPGHGLPFTGLHERIDQQIAHHDERCTEIAEACRTRPLSAAELVPVVFPRPLDAHQTGFAFGEILAHVNFLHRRGRLSLATGRDEVVRASAA